MFLYAFYLFTKHISQTLETPSLVGNFVVQRYDRVKFQQADRIVYPDALHIYIVKGEKGDKLFLQVFGGGPEYWVSRNDFVFLDNGNASSYFNFDTSNPNHVATGAIV